LGACPQFKSQLAQYRSYVTNKCVCIGRDFWHTNAVSGLPSVRMSDGPNGVRGTKFFNGVPAACFPCGTALGSLMDKELLYKAGELMAKEAKAKGAHIVLGPTVNMQRSPLGGRGFESFSEDPLLSGSAAAAVISGMQDNGIQATIKHYVGNDQEDERSAVNAIIPERALREIYLKPFQIAMRDANPGMVMTAYNKVNAVHAAECKRLLIDILRKEWGWQGAVTSDWFGTYSTIDAVKGGLDIEMPGPAVWRGKLLSTSLSTRTISMNDIDDRARAVVRLVRKCMAESGVPEDAPEGANDTPETAKLLRQLAAESLVLLKNDDNVLPLAKNKTTAVIGSNGKVASFCGGGSASMRPYYKVTPYDGIARKLESEPQYAIGVDSSLTLPLAGDQLTTEDGSPGFTFKTYNLPRADPNRKHVDTLHLVDSSMFLADYDPGLPKDKPYYIDITGYFTPEEDGMYEFGVIVTGTALLYVNDELVVDNATVQRPGDAFLGSGTVEEKGTIHLKKGVKYKVFVQFGGAATSKLKRTGTPMFGGALRLGLRKQFDASDELSKAVEIAKSVDQVILTLGLNSDFESEGFDRKHMDLPPHVDELVEAVSAVNKNTVVVMQSGTPVTLPWIDHVKGYVHAWYGGNETGNGIADVLFGDVNPSGKLPLTFPKQVQDNPAFLNYSSENGVVVYGENVYVGYRYYQAVGRDPLYHFGHGLSYTSFSYKTQTIDVRGGDGLDGELLVSVDVTNEGKLAGKDTVQVYISQQNPTIGRPPHELKGYGKVYLTPGETKTVHIKTPLKEACSYWDDSREKWIMEKGNYEVHVATSSVEIRHTEVIEIGKTVWWTGL
jgi:beta-glucosidase